MELCHLEGHQVSRSGQSLMTSISGPECQIDINIGYEKHDGHENVTLFFIDLTWNVPI